ncbi:NAD-P-binding protein [Athelia psychrophila]|uniref:NAD-P-binding protein n=1 Tax=Athelia psychrophila TaxID=1759441 RepID=A0A165ZFZ9_9AGAM|nr:NAD-P-binding protein [Fibularhizoctonia sp. CBS 109695]
MFLFLTTTMSSFQAANLFGVKDKVVLITGGSRGIGKMIATGFVANGAKVYISARSAKDCDETAKELTAMGPGTCFAIPADLQKVEAVNNLVQELSSKEKALHVLINNAGAAWGDSIDDHPDEAFTKVLTLNLQRVFTLTQKCLPLLRAAAEAGGKNGNSYRDPARIINVRFQTCPNYCPLTLAPQIGSVEGLAVPDHETYAYSASKAALHQLSNHMAGRLGGEGIHSNVIACGLFPSKMTAYTIKTAGDVVLADIPSARAGLPEEVAGTALYLASRASGYTNGATIAIDGGLLVHMPSFKL